MLDHSGVQRRWTPEWSRRFASDTPEAPKSNEKGTALTLRQYRDLPTCQNNYTRVTLRARLRVGRDQLPTENDRFRHQIGRHQFRCPENVCRIPVSALEGCVSVRGSVRGTARADADAR